MNISLDYDDTYTRDPKLWDTFILAALALCHTIYCVTMRFPSAPTEFPPDIPIKTIYTSHKAKMQAVRDQGINIDVWVDDSPGWIFQDAAA